MRNQAPSAAPKAASATAALSSATHSLIDNWAADGARPDDVSAATGLASRFGAPRRVQNACMLQRASRTVVAGLIAILVVSATLYGTLDELPGWQRGIAQTLGTLAGVYLGASWQMKDQRTATQGAAMAAIANLVAVGAGIRSFLDALNSFRKYSSAAPPRSIDASVQSVEGLFIGLESHARAVLAQAEAAASSWLPFVDDQEALKTMLAGVAVPQPLNDVIDGGSP